MLPVFEAWNAFQRATARALPQAHPHWRTSSRSPPPPKCVPVQGRGLGGRVCTRRAQIGSDTITWDHGCQYLSPKAAAFQVRLRSHIKF